MRKRQFFLFVCFAFLFLLFALFQNFSFLKWSEYKLIPENSDYIGNLRAPQGYLEYSQHKIALSKEPIIFDHSKFLKETYKSSPLYHWIHDFIEVDDENPSTSVSCETNKCNVPKNKKFFKLSAKPAKAEANLDINLISDFDTGVHYCGNESNLTVHMNRKIDSTSQIKLQYETKDQASSLLWSTNW